MWKPFLFVLAIPMLSAAQAQDCFQLYYGAGRDLPRARACFEQTVAQSSSTDLTLERLYLATMYLDGQGGPPDAAKAKSLVACCADNWDVELLFQEAQKRAAVKTPPAKSLDYCRDAAGSTMMLRRCGGLQSDLLKQDAAAMQERLLNGLDDRARSLYREATTKFDEFVKADAASVAEEVRGGTAEPLYYEGSANQHAETRNALLKQLAAYRANPDRNGQSLRLADEAVRKADEKLISLANGRMGDLLRKAHTAWGAYRDAEAAFFGQALSNRFDRTAVELDVKVGLATQRGKELTDRLGEPYFIR